MRVETDGACVRVATTYVQYFLDYGFASAEIGVRGVGSKVSAYLPTRKPALVLLWC
jgi:hypothetical protein